ncbi:MAG: hypothetical protein AVDCRST_MAG05-2911, partial [uncultured Rubrobacteraceae bacterium]
AQPHTGGDPQHYRGGARPDLQRPDRQGRRLYNPPTHQHGAHGGPDRLDPHAHRGPLGDRGRLPRGQAQQREVRVQV